MLFQIRRVGRPHRTHRFLQAAAWLSVIVSCWLIGTFLALVSHRRSSFHDATVDADAPHLTAAPTAWNVIAVRQNPLGIGAEVAWRQLVPRSELRRLLNLLVPRWDTFKTARALHGLRLWGPKAEFECAGPIAADDIAAQMRSSHERLLQLRGGWSIRYHLAVEQDADRGTFAFTAIDGVFRVKWPKLYCYIRGPGSVIRESHREVITYEREAVYDFATQTSVARNRDVLVQIAPYRHAWSSKYAFPLLFQYFVESSQFYVPGVGLANSAGKTRDYWIPESLRKNHYVVSENQMVDGVACVLLERPGRDRIWVAPAFNFGLVRREIYQGPNTALCERTTNSQWQEIGPDVWLPMRQIDEHYDLGTSPSNNSLLNYRLILTVSNAHAGDLTDQDFEILIPDGAEVDDEITGLLYRKLPDGANPTEHALSNARRLLQEHRPLVTRATSRIPFLVLTNLAVLLAVAIILVWRHGRSENSEKTPSSRSGDKNQ